MKRTSRKPLQLNKETIRALTEVAMRNAAGGIREKTEQNCRTPICSDPCTRDDSIGCYPSFTCVSNCTMP